MDDLVEYYRGPCTDENAWTHWSRPVGTFKRLSKMAKAYVAVPVTSTPCEQLFSKAKYYIPASRNRLDPGALKESVLLASWTK